MIRLRVVFSITLLLGGFFNPVAAEAQQAANVARIGVLVLNRATNPRGHEAFRQGLRDLGYVEVRNVVMPGNRNGVEGPRLGRQGKEAAPLPRSRPDTRLPQRRRRAKTGGRDFAKGQNSHDGEVFRRTEDQLPRGNGTLMLRIVFHDIREKLYKNLCKLGDTPKTALLFAQEYIDRTEGRPVKKIEHTEHPPAIFVFTNPDGTETPALPAPQKVGGGATAAASAEDLVILNPALLKA